MSAVMIHQPEYLPWTGLFMKMSACDVFVFLDDVQYLRRSYQNRNLIKHQGGQQWLTVPLARAPREQRIMDMIIDPSKDWQRSHVDALRGAYKSAPYYREGWALVEPIYRQEWASLSDLNCALTERIAHALDFRPRFIRASALNAGGVKSERILNICLALKARRYISGIGAKMYLCEEDFRARGVDITYIPPFQAVYPQLYPENGFQEGLSVIDYLFNCGTAKVHQTLVEMAKPYLAAGERLGSHA